jgi:hypothetical protein
VAAHNSGFGYRPSAKNCNIFAMQHKQQWHKQIKQLSRKAG